MTTIKAPSKAQTKRAPLVPTGPFPSLMGSDFERGSYIRIKPSLHALAKYFPHGDQDKQNI